MQSPIDSTTLIGFVFNSVTWNIPYRLLRRFHDDWDFLRRNFPDKADWDLVDQMWLEEPYDSSGIVSEEKLINILFIICSFKL